MARTESCSFQVHPNDEQNQIGLMQKFHWSLLSSQEIKTADSHLEQRGNTIYSVSTTENYVKLTFTREIDLPNIKEIKELEEQYDALPIPDYPKLFPGSFWFWLIASFIYGLGIIGWAFYYFALYSPKKEVADKLHEKNTKKRNELLKELEQYN